MTLRLFISLYCDEDVSAIAAAIIAGRGFEVLTTQAAGCSGSSDSAQLRYAADLRLTLLTHNRADFEKLSIEYSQSGRGHAGIIIAVRRQPRELARRVLGILNHVTADEMMNQIRYV